MSESEILEKLSQALTNGDDLLAADLAKQALKKGISAIDILNKGCTPGMLKAGEMYASGSEGPTHRPSNERRIHAGGTRSDQALPESRKS